MQVGKSSQNMSMVSATESDAVGEFSRTVALYRGMKVDVYIVDITDINLTRQDLVDLIRVCSVLCCMRVYYVSVCL